MRQLPAPRTENCKTMETKQSLEAPLYRSWRKEIVARRLAQTVHPVPCAGRQPKNDEMTAACGIASSLTPSAGRGPTGPVRAVAEPSKSIPGTSPKGIPFPLASKRPCCRPPRDLRHSRLSLLPGQGDSKQFPHFGPAGRGATTSCASRLSRRSRFEITPALTQLGKIIIVRPPFSGRAAPAVRLDSNRFSRPIGNLGYSYGNGGDRGQGGLAIEASALAIRFVRGGSLGDRAGFQSDGNCRLVVSIRNRHIGLGVLRCRHCFRWWGSMQLASGPQAP